LRIFIFELKYNNTPQKSLKQIIEKKYYEKYKRFKKSITLIGMALNSQRKGFTLDWIPQDCPQSTTYK